MSSRPTKVGDVIRILQENHNPDDLLAIQWWCVEDFEEYKDKETALYLAQTYLDYSNEELTNYVASEYQDEEEEDNE
jgi:hypothetical protein